jgi:ABC-type multidrug transport system fused ATPase/permease subunit
MKKLLSILSYLRPYRSLAALNIIFNLLTAIFSIISLVLLGPFLDILFKEEAPTVVDPAATAGFMDQLVAQFNYFLVNYLIDHGRSATLVLVCGLIIICFFFKNLSRYLALFVMAPVRNGIEYDLRQQVFVKLISLPLSYFSDSRKGDLMSRMSSDVKEVQWSVLRSLETLVRSPITLLGSLLVMLYISPYLTAFSFGLFLFVGLIIGQLSRMLKRKSSKAQASLGRILSLIDEVIGGLRVVQGFGAEAYQTAKFEEENSYNRRLNNKIQRRKDLSSPLTEFLGICVIAALLLYGGHLVFGGGFEASTFVMFILMFYNIIDPAKSFASALYDLQKGRAAAARLEEILAKESEIKEVEQPLPLTTFEDSLELKKLSFAYEEGQKVLNQISFRLEKGKSIALVGVSGSGKSTIADLLPRFYDPQEGEILIDGENIKNYKLAELRALFGLVSQDAILFHDSIYNNIVFGLENVSPQAVETAAKIAHAHDFIMQTDEGYQTVIGDRGMKLSGGQRQRLTIARAILRNPEILILDEATSALDSESEQAVQAALEEVLKDRTSIIIAHRLSTIQHADEILVMQAGEIVERGDHQSLLAQQGVYKKLVDLQSI